MKISYNRRKFIKNTVTAGILFGIADTTHGFILKKDKKNLMENYKIKFIKNKRIGIIGLDTSHSIAFTKALNDPSSGDEFDGFKVVAAYPKGSNDIQSSVVRIPGYTEEVKALGVEIVKSIEELLIQVDVVLLETNDGRLHLEQALQVMKAGKRMFIDKPLAASLSDAMAIFKASKRYNVPIFSASSLRYITGAKEIEEGEIGKVFGVDAYSPAMIEKTHPDLFWYGIHGVEILYTILGKGCKSVARVYTEDTDLVVGTWKGDRIGSFRGIRAGKFGFGGTVFGENDIKVLGKWEEYIPLLKDIIEFFRTGIAPVSPEETLEIYAFMEAADESKRKGGASVTIDSIFQKAAMNTK